MSLHSFLHGFASQQVLPRRTRRSRRASPLRIEELEARILMNASNEQLVARLYDDLLQRPADAQGLQYWNGLLDQGVSRGQIALGFLESSEHQAQDLGSLYGTLLGRGPDAAGL